MRTRLSIQDVQPWGVRLALLIMVGVPPFTGWPILRAEHSELVRALSSGIPSFEAVLPWLLYGAFVWLFIGLLAGGRVLLNFASVAAILGFTLLLWNGTLGRLPLLAGDKTDLQISITALSQLVKILTIVPFALFCVHSFSVSGALLWLSKYARGRSGSAVHIVLFMRVFQTVVEAFIRLLDAWKEENPRMFFPRFPGKMDKTLLSRTQWVDWFAHTAWAWCVASLVFGLEPIPSLVDETKKVRESVRQTSTQAH